MSEQRPAGDACEADEAVVGAELVVVDDGFEDLSGEGLDGDLDTVGNGRPPDDVQLGVGRRRT